MSFQYAVTQNDFNVTFGTSQLIPVQTFYLKFSANIENWPWKNLSNSTSLCLNIDLQTESSKAFPAFSFVQGPSLTASSRLQLFRDGNPIYPTSIFEVVLFNSSLRDFDNSTFVPVNYGIQNGILSDANRLWIALPHFESTIDYDPNLGVLENGKPGSSGGDGNDNLAWIAAVAAVPVLLCIILLIIVAVLAFFLYR